MEPVHCEPTTAEGVAAALVEARRAGRRLVPHGAASKLRWLDEDTAAGAALSTRGLAGAIAHYAGDLVATIPAGVTLADANRTLASARQWLPLDPSFADRATIGGIVATNDSGPRRHKHGAPRNLIIGIEMALTDGRVARAGGRVVKNVAGYDLSRLLCGSWGSLAVITSATFKLAPLAPASITMVADCSSLSQAVELTQVLSIAPMTPSAFEIEAPEPRLLIRFETTAAAAERMAESARQSIEPRGAAVHLVSGDAEDQLWDAHNSVPWAAPGSVLKISVLPTDTRRVFEVLSSRPGLRWAAIGRIALGVLLVRLDGDAADLTATIASLRAAANGGHVRLLTAGDALRSQLPRAAAPAAADIMRAVKQRFDPGNVLPGVPLES